MPAESTSKRPKNSDDGNMCLLSPAIISDTRSQQSRSNSNSCLSRSYKNHALIDKFSKILEEEKQQQQKIAQQQRHAELTIVNLQLTEIVPSPKVKEPWQGDAVYSFINTDEQ